MLDAFFFGLDVAVEHGGVRGQADLVRGAGDVQPLLAADFVVADDFAHARIENFRAAAGQRIHAGVLERQQRIADGQFGDAREIADLDHGEGFQVHGRAALLEAAHHVQEIFEGQIGMQAADHVKFGGSFAHALFGALPDFFEGEGVGAGRVGIAAEGAEFAMGHANVGGIDVAIDVEVADVAVALLANVVREPAEGEQVGRAVERQAVGGVQALAGQDLRGDGLEPRVVNHQIVCQIRHLCLRFPSSVTAYRRATATAAPQNSRNSKLI